MDGEPEYLYQGRSLNAVVETRGAGLAELDFLPCSWNYLGTMARWPQPYHHYKYEGCDSYLRQAFLDHFFGAETQIEAFDRMSYAEQGDFLDQPFEVVHLRREHEDIGLARTGRLRLRRRDHPFTVQKRYRFKDAAVECALLLRNDSAADLELWYGLELNLALASRGEAHLLALKGSQKKELGSERAEADKLDGVLVRDPANRWPSAWSPPAPSACGACRWRRCPTRPPDARASTSPAAWCCRGSSRSPLGSNGKGR